MPRRLLISLLTALALLLAAAPASFAASAASAPAARTASDDDPGDVCADDELWSEDDDGTVTCSGDEAGDGDDVTALCDDDTPGDDDSSDDDSGDDDDASAASAGDCDDEVSAAAPKLTALQAKLAGAGRRAQVKVTFELDAPGEVKLTLERIAAGTASGKRCVATPKKSRTAKRTSSRRGAKSCTRGVAVGGSFLVDGDEGANTAEPRRWKGRRLTAGSYRVTATPTDDGGASSTAAFTIAAVR